MTHRSTIRRALAVCFATTVVAIGVAGCASVGDAGSAAVVGDTHISTGDVDTQVQEVQQARGTELDRPSQGLVTDTVRRLVITDLVNQACASKGVSVTQGQVDDYFNQVATGLGGEQAMEQLFLDNNVPPSAMKEQVRLSLQLDALGKALVPAGGDADPKAAAAAFVIDYGNQVGIEVSPRFGTWEPDKLAVGPLPTDLATPASGDLTIPLSPAG